MSLVLRCRDYALTRMIAQTECNFLLTNGLYHSVDIESVPVAAYFGVTRRGKNASSAEIVNSSSGNICCSFVDVLVDGLQL